MDEGGVYLGKVSAFSRMLRLEGLSVGYQETMDARRVLITGAVEAAKRDNSTLK